MNTQIEQDSPPKLTIKPYQEAIFAVAMLLFLSAIGLKMEDVSKPLIIAGVTLLAVVLFVVIFPDKIYSFTFTEESVTIYELGRELAVIPWEEVQWAVEYYYSRRNEHYNVYIQAKGVEPTFRYPKWLNKLLDEEEPFASGFLIDEGESMVQVMLVCCPNPPVKSNYTPVRNYPLLSPNNIIPHEKIRRRQRWSLPLCIVGLLVFVSGFPMFVRDEGFFSVGLGLIAAGAVLILLGAYITGNTTISFAAEVLWRRVKREHPM